DRGTTVKELLVDADCGVDDAQTAMMALAVPNMQILGIARVHGNTTVENVCKTSYACCMLIPVFTGASKALLGNAINAEHFHGQDGLGDAPDTNFNFAVDPEEAYIVLNDYLCPTYITSWEFTCRRKFPWVKRSVMTGQGLISCDSCAMAAAIDDTFITESDRKAAAVGLSGTRKAYIMQKVDLEKFKKLIMECFEVIRGICTIHVPHTLLVAFFIFLSMFPGRCCF
uniref:Si:dkey-4e7.3 n=1 Tax=Electrophorus electricus TaxID=8005 RepID=A0AAY5EZ91_ELEEL